MAIDEARRPADPLQPDQLAVCDPDAYYAVEDKAWDNMVPIGREFGSPGFERLMEEDAQEFESNLARLIEECKRSEIAKQISVPMDYLQDAVNVQTALWEFGQDVSVPIAAAVWEQHSQSLAAGRMAGANTVQSAKMTIFRYCSGQPNK